MTTSFPEDRRITGRHRTNTHIIVKTDAHTRVKVLATNLSTAGVLLKTDNMDLTLHKPYEAVFVIDLGGVQRIHHRIVVPRHKTGGSTGCAMMPMSKRPVLEHI